jgi:amino acid efflux transporter
MTTEKNAIPTPFTPVEGHRAPPGEFARSLRWYHAAAITTGSVLGSGVLVLPALTAEVAGPASLLAWLLLAVLSFPLALLFARLAAKIPHAGGVLAYIAAALGSPLSKSAGWMLLLMYPIGVPIVAVIGADYAGSVVGLNHTEITLIAALILTSSVLLHVRGIELASWIQVIITVLIAAMLVIAIVAALPHVHWSNFRPFMPHGFASVGLAAVLTFWCFVGWEAAGSLTEEFVHPERDVPMGLAIAAILVSVLYLALAFVTIGTKVYGGHLSLAPLSALVGTGFGVVATKMTAILALLITFGTVHTNTASFSRMVFAQARDGHFPKRFASLHPKYGTPIGALMLLLALCALALLSYGLLHPSLAAFVKIVSVSDISIYCMCLTAALFVLTGTAVRSLAVLCLFVCAIVYCFSGWTALIPVGLLGAGWLFFRASRSR